MSELDRRNLMVVAYAVLVSACADTHPVSHPVWVVVRPSDDGSRIYVDTEEAELADVDAVVLAHALAANPSLDEANARERVGVYLRTEGDVDYRAMVDMLQRIRFERVGLVAEDRRS